ncbi:MAG: glycosyltransferase [Elusimicrobiota bacterium]
MKTVIHYLRGPYLETTENWIFNQIKNLSRYKPVVYCHGIKNLDIFPIQNIISLDLAKSFFNPVIFFNKLCSDIFHFYPSFALFLAKDKPVIIHAHFGPAGYWFLPLKKLFKLPLVTTFYGYDLSKLPKKHTRWQKRYKKLFRYGEIFLVEGSHMKKCLMELGCPETKIIVHHLGVDLNNIKFMPRKISADGEIKILVCGRFKPKKGIPDAVEAFGIVKNKIPNLKLKLTIIGNSCGSQLEELEKTKILNKIKKYKIENSIDLLGYKPYSFFLKEIYRNHIFLSPSITPSDGETEGGVPVSIIEASASGMPVVSTTHCDIPEVILDGHNGYLVPEQDVESLAEKLKFLVLNPDSWYQLGLKGREHIEKNYDIIKQTYHLEKIYDNLTH